MLSHLNPQQLAAVQHIDNPLLVLAGAGSGKTGVITQKINWLLENGYEEEEIIAVTFTNKAAQEMNQRVRELRSDSKKTSALQISTFHRLGMRILYREAGLIGLRSGFSIVSRDDCVAMLANFEPKLQNFEAKQVAQLVDILSQWKNQGILAEDAPKALNDESTPMHHQAAEIYADFDHYLIACNSVDIDGLLTLPMRIFKQFPEALTRWQQRCRYLLVDEYQDTNHVQYELVRMLASASKGLTVVGDDDQSIYTWRGADSRNISNLERDFPDLTVIKLEQNYRCTNTILKAANALIAHNDRQFEKNLWSAGSDGSPIKVLSCQDETDEAQAIVESISGRAFVSNSSYDDFAVLLRSNHQARHFEKALRESRIPYSYTGGQSMFERTEIKDMLAYLRFIANEDDTSALLRVVNTPRRGIGAATLSQLADISQRYNKSLNQVCSMVNEIQSLQAAQRMRVALFVDSMAEIRKKVDDLPADEIYDAIIKEIEYVAYLEENSENMTKARIRIERVLELKKWIGTMASRGKSLNDIVRDFALLNREDTSTSQEGRVNLCTMHSAKGLEFENVYIVGLEEELLPHRNSVAADSIEEERRLMYVAITRAKQTLTLSYCLSRKALNERRSVTPSRFLDEIPADLITEEGEGEAEITQQEFESRLDELLESIKKST